jgi:hypothetical protein
MDGFRDARRDALIAAALVAIIASLLTLWTSGLLVVLGLTLMVVGVVVSITVIGAIIGIPLFVLGVLGLLAGVISGSGGVPFAVLLGVAAGYVYFRYRLRALGRLTQSSTSRRLVR